MAEDRKDSGVPDEGSTEGESDEKSHSLTRRQALGAGAAAVGGLALGELGQSAGARAAAPPAGTVSPDFRKVLARLASDPKFARAAVLEPVLVTKGNKLTLLDLQVLRDVAILSGADVAAVNRLRANSISAATNQVGVARIPGDGIHIPISCCCSCCCI